MISIFAGRCATAPPRILSGAEIIGGPDKPGHDDLQINSMT